MGRAVERPRVLLLPGWFSDGSRKAADLRALGYDVVCPRLSDWSFDRAVRAARAAHDAVRPDVVVGASRGGAAALALGVGTPLVLLAPAWRWWGVRPRVAAPAAVVLHARHDRLVPFADSVNLCDSNPGVRLVAVGDDHRLNDPAARVGLRPAVRRVLRAGA